MKQIENTDYYITKEGNVYSKKTGDLVLMKYHVSTHGYKALRLMLNKKSKMQFIHRLIALAYIENPNNKPCVNHIDGNKLNNDISNLEWVTYSENNKHAFDTGLKKPTTTNVKEVSIISKCGFFFKKFKSLKDAANYLQIDSRRVSDFRLCKRKHQLYNFI